MPMPTLLTQVNMFWPVTASPNPKARAKADRTTINFQGTEGRCSMGTGRLCGETRQNPLKSKNRLAAGKRHQTISREPGRLI